MTRVLGILCLALPSFLCAPIVSYAECDPRSFMIQDVKHVQQTGDTEIAFVLSASKEEFDSAKQNGSVSGAYGIISGSANYSQAKERATKIAQSIKFDYKSSYARDFFTQSISPLGADAYGHCLERDKEKPGLALWFYKRDGQDYYKFKAFWVGKDTTVPAAGYDGEPVVDGARIVSKPSSWIKGKTEEITLKREGNEDFFFELKVGGETKSAVVVKDPPSVTWKTKTVKAENLISVKTTTDNPKCRVGQGSHCIVATEPGGYFLDGSVLVDEKSSTEPSTFSQVFTVKTPIQACITITQGTTCCECQQSAKGRLVGIETYPVAAE